jgi:Family of unknown function (DUF6789)
MKDGQLVLTTRSAAASALVLALLAGFVASVGMLLAFGVAFAAALLLGRLPLPVISDWFRGLTNNALIDTAGPNLYAATAIFFFGGLLWSMLYGLVFEPRVKGRSWERGVKFALIPWLFSLVIFMPLIGGGVLGLGLGAGPLPILGNLILHAVWGAVLGVVYGSAESVFDRPSHKAYADELQAGRLSEVAAARGMIAGLALGVLVGAVGALVVPQGLSNPMAMVVAVGLTGAAFGGFVGSLSTPT